MGAGIDNSWVGVEEYQVHRPWKQSLGKSLDEKVQKPETWYNNKGKHKKQIYHHPPELSYKHENNDARSR